MNEKINQRKVEIEKIRKDQEEKRQKVLQELKTSVIELNKTLRELGLPEYPPPQPRKGQEEQLLRRFKNEQKQRDIQFQRKKEELKRRETILRKRFDEKLKTLNKVFKKLGIPNKNYTFNIESAEKTIQQMDNDIALKQKEFAQKMIAEKKSTIEKLKGSHRKLLSEKKLLESEYKTNISQIEKLEKSLKIKSKQSFLKTLPWELPEFETLAAFFPLNQDQPYHLSSLDRKEIVIDISSNKGSLFGTGRFGKAPILNGTDQLIRFENYSIPNNGFNIMFWAKPNKLISDIAWIHLTSDENPKDSLIFGTNNGSYFISTFLNEFSRQYSIGVTANKNQWQHISVEFDYEKKQTSLYINGEQVWSQRIRRISSALNRLTVGAKKENQQHYSGLIDEIMLFNLPLSQKTYSKGGLQQSDFMLQNQLTFLRKNTNQVKQSLEALKEKEKEVIIANQKKKEEQEKRLKEKLKALNKIHQELAEKQEELSDFNAFAPENRERIIESRLRRAKRRYKNFQNAAEEEKAFVKASAEIESIWESIQPILTTLKINMNKPAFNKDNINQVLSKLKKDKQKLDVRYQNTKKELEAKYQSQKLELAQLFNELTQLNKKINVPTSFTIDESKENIVKNLNSLKTLITKKKTQYNKQLEAIKQKKIRDISKLLKNFQNQKQRLREAYKSLGQQFIPTTPPIFTNRPDNLIGSFSSEKTSKGRLLNWLLEPRITLNQVQILPVTNQKFNSSLNFNGSSSSASMYFNPGEIEDGLLTISFYLKQNRAWKEKTIIHIPTQTKDSFLVTTERNQIRLVYIPFGKQPQKSVPLEVSSVRWKNLIISLDLKNQKFQLYSDDFSKPKMTISFPPLLKIASNMHIGNQSKTNSYFSGDIEEINIFNSSLNKDTIQFIQKNISPQFTENANDILINATKQIEVEIRNKTQSLAEKEKLKQQQLDKVKAEIEKLKAELAKYLGKERVTFSIVIGQEEKSLEKLRIRVRKAKTEYEKNLALKAKRLEELQIAISTKQNTLNQLAKKLGQERPRITIKKGREQEGLDLINKSIILLKKSIKEKEIAQRNEIQKMKLEVGQLKTQIEQFHHQLGTPKEKQILPNANLELKQYYKEISNIYKNVKVELEKKKLKESQEQREKFLSKWEAQYKQLQSLLKEINEKPLILQPPELGKELDALANLSQELGKAKRRKQEIEKEEKNQINKLQSTFNKVSRKVIPVLKELNQPSKIIIVFDGASIDKAKKSIENINKLLTEKTKELEKKRQQEKERLSKLAKTTDGLLKAVFEEKSRILNYAKELKLKNYKPPTRLGESNSIETSLFSYYKFDALKNKTLIDSLETSSKSFITPFSTDSKVVGKFGFAVQLNGLDQYINLEIPDTFQRSNGLTISFWISPARRFGNRTILSSQSTSGTEQLKLYVENTFLHLNGKINNLIISEATKTSLTRKEWTHVVLTVSSNNTLQIFFKGESILKKKVPEIAKLKWLGKSLIFGSEYEKTENLFSGKFDDLKLYSKSTSKNDIQNTMQEIDISAKVLDIDLLKEELGLLEDESKKLKIKIKQRDDELEEIRLRKASEIETLIEAISEYQTQMGLSLFRFPYESGEEDNALKELQEIRSAKEKELSNYRAEIKKKKDQFNKKAKILESKIKDLEIKLKKEKRYTLTLRDGLEREVIQRAATHLRQLEKEYQAYLKTLEEKTALEIRNTIFTRLDELNSILFELDKSPHELNDIPEGKEQDTLKKLDSLIVSSRKELESKNEAEMAKIKLIKEKEEREQLTQQYQNFTREISSIQQILGIEDDVGIEKQLDPSARVYLNFNEGRGRLIKDKSENENRASFQDFSFEWVETGRYGNSVYLNGDGGKLVIQSSPSLNEITDFSMMIWINPERLYDKRQIIWLGESDSPRLNIMLEDEKLILGLSKDTKIDTGVTLEKNKWQHISLTYNHEKNLLSLFISGKLIEEFEFSRKTLFLNTPIYIGSNLNNQFFTGLLDDFKVFSRVLTPSEIIENQREGIPKIEPGLETIELETFKQKISELEVNLMKLRERKISAEKKRLELEKRLQKENKILLSARRNKYLKLFETYSKAINKLQRKVSVDVEKLTLPKEGNEEEELEILKDKYTDLEQKYLKIAKVAPIIELKEKSISQNDQLFTDLRFEKAKESTVKDNNGIHNGEFTSNASDYLRKGIRGKGLEVGEGGYLKIPNSNKIPYNLIQSFQFWIFPYKSSLQNSLLLQRGNLSLEIKNKKLRFLIGDVIFPFDNVELIEAEQWYFINLSIDEFSGVIKLSLGEKMGSTQFFNTRLRNPDGTIYISGSPNVASRFNGIIDELKIYHRQLYSKDMENPIIYNLDMKSQFSRLSPQLLNLKLQAKGCESMKIYQEGRSDNAKWESFRNQKILEIEKPRKHTKRVVIIGEFKTRYSDLTHEIRKEIEVPPFNLNPRFVLPPINVDLSTN